MSLLAGIARPRRALHRLGLALALALAACGEPAPPRPAPSPSASVSAAPARSAAAAPSALDAGPVDAGTDASAKVEPWPHATPVVVRGERGMVVSDEAIATGGGRDVLAAGGNAADAAVALAFALAVTYPTAG
ncbi:MAG: gamma-glutamyltransferase, partial [Myxococcales bacterium]|nr:gamma-glutamyltransferase [Myxococcales bacterium]